MNKFWISCCFILLGVSLNAQALKTARDSFSYSSGILFAKQLKTQGADDINLEILHQAINSYFDGETPIIDPSQAQKIVVSYQQKKSEKVNEVNKVAGEKFLAENAKRPEVTVLPSGLQYEILTKGDGTDKPNLSSKVTVHYHGTTIDGQVFDSSVQRGETISFGLSQVITGWQEGVALMSPGDKFKLYIPYDMAYGDRGAGALIKPYSALIFEVELFSFK